MKRLYREELAWAMEMLNEGWQQKYVAMALSVKAETLRRRIRDAEINGATDRPHKRITKVMSRHTNGRARWHISRRPAPSGMRSQTLAEGNAGRPGSGGLCNGSGSQEARPASSGQAAGADAGGVAQGAIG